MRGIIQHIEKNQICGLITNRELFIKIYIIVSILWFFPALGIFIDPICKICFVWGAFLVFYDIVAHRIILQTSYWYWIFLLLGLYCITILLNIQDNFYMGIKHLIYTMISLVIVFAQNGQAENGDKIKLLKFINSVVAAVVFCAGLISLIMYCFRISIYFEQNGVVFRQGFLENRLFGVYTSPNVGALFSIICIAAMCINSYYKNKSLFKWGKFYIVNGIIQILYFSLTLSNGGLLTACVFVTLLTIVFGFMEFKKNKKLISAVSLTILLIIMSIIGLNLIVQGIRTAMSIVPSAISYVTSQAENNEEDSMHVIQFERIESGDDASNGRTAIWSGSLKIWSQAPIFGIADARINEDNIEQSKYSFDELNEFEIERLTSVDGNLHNAYIQILVNSGVAGFSCFLILIVLIVKKYVKYLFAEDTQNTSYKIVGMLFCVLGAVGANGMVENHLLFNRQDPYGLLFWFYLGCGLIMIESVVSEPRFKDYFCREQKEKFLFYCDTPLQLFNSINFVINNQMNSREKADLIIVHQFRDSYKIANRIRQQGIYKHVYDAIPLKERKGLSSKVCTLLRTLWPRKAVCRCLEDITRQMTYKYRYYFLSFLTPVSISLQLANTCADMYLIEDGLGTYVGDIENDFTSPLCKWINKYFLSNRMALKPQAIYLNCPQLCHSRIKAKFEKLPVVNRNSESFKKLQNVFDYSIDESSDLCKIMYITQPLEEVRECVTNAEEKIIQLLGDNIDRDLIEIRIHPRQKDFNTAGLKVSDNSQMWEMECINRIDSNFILISAYSTALFMPKILKDSEPVLVFIYKLLLSDKEQQNLKEVEAFIKDFAREYNDSSKIYIPKNMDEFKEILNAYIIEI